jgi:hypothetical protein
MDVSDAVKINMMRVFEVSKFLSSKTKNLRSTQNKNPSAKTELVILTPIANFNGRSEKEIIISDASLTLFLIVYEGLPENLVP